MTTRRSRAKLAVVAPGDQKHDDWLSKLPAASAYAGRVGAVERSLLRLAVRVEAGGGYHREVASIKIDESGEVSVFSNNGDPKPYMPTAEEAKRIAAEVSKADLPKCIPAPVRAAQAHARSLEGRTFIFRDESGEKALFVQQRVDGFGKDYLPWTFWSDGEWRMKEPPDELPLFGLEGLKSYKPVMIHEGAKAAAFVQGLIDDPELKGELVKHPWASALQRFTHIGWVGGAANPHRTDWEPIKKLAGREIVVICDKDQVGIDAVSEISRRIRLPISAVIFDDRFPENFDLADAWPVHEGWWKGHRYYGPTFDDLLKPATWATGLVLNGKKGRPQIRLRKEFAAEWMTITKPPLVVNRKRPHRPLSPDEFDRSVRPFSDAEGTYRLLIQHRSSQVEGVTYRPGQLHGVITDDGIALLNTFRPSDTKPVEGDPSPWLKFMEHLVPDEGDRLKLLRWCATLIAMPGVRMRYGVLLISETQGVGKSTLGEILRKLVGPWNCSFPSESAVVDSTFNEWMAHRRLAVVNEIYSGHSRKAYDKLKSVITDATVTVSRKYVEPYELPNYLHVLACSNSMKALHLDDADRRWLVPRVTERKRTGEEWAALYAWLAADGHGIIRWWSEEFLRTTPPVNTGDHAPPTSAKAEIIEESRSDGARLASDLAERVLELMQTKEQRCVVAVPDVREWVARKRGMDVSDRRMESLLTLRNAMRAAGLREPPGGAKGRFDVAVPRPGGQSTRYPKARVMANFDIDEHARWADLEEFFRTADDLWPM